MPKGAFEPIVMFFRLTNSPATFQAIIYNLLRDMIEAGDIITLIDDVMVGMKIEKGHNNIVKEVLRRITEDDLFIKLEKYMWKVREIRFLEVVIEQDGMEIEKKKVQEVVNWPCIEVFAVKKLLQIVCQKFQMDNKTHL